MPINSYPRETVEFQAITVTKDGVPVTTGVTTSVVAHGERPVTWVAAVVLGAEIGVMLTALTPGTYDIYAKVSDAPETPVIDCGSIAIT